MSSDIDNNPYTLNLTGTFYTLEQINELCQGQSPALYPDLPQIAFAGRSNVGKSSLINALGGRKGLAKVSATPGKTASINFYLAQNQNPAFKSFYLVDLPGYGYAKRSKAERAKWADLINAYLQNSQRLSALCVLLDCRLEPQDADLELMAFARSLNLKLLPLLTKADKCGASEQAGRQAQWKKLLAGQSPLLTSVARTKSSAQKESNRPEHLKTDPGRVWGAMLTLLGQG